MLVCISWAGIEFLQRIGENGYQEQDVGLAATSLEFRETPSR